MPLVVQYAPDGSIATELLVERSEFTIGRGNADVLVRDRSVSSRHARIRATGTEFIVVDLGSTNGTTIRQRKILEERVAEGEPILLGNCPIALYYDIATAERDARQSALRSTEILPPITPDLGDELVPVGEAEASGMVPRIPIRLSDLPVLIGSSPHCTIYRTGVDLSAEHVRMTRRNGSFHVQSLDVSRPIRVNHQSTVQCVLCKGDLLEVGNLRFRVQSRPVEGSPTDVDGASEPLAALGTDDFVPGSIMRVPTQVVEPRRQRLPRRPASLSAAPVRLLHRAVFAALAVCAGLAAWWVLFR